jgi:CheY-like chemotaxis protein
MLTAESGRDARDVARTRQPDVILLDVSMAGESGFETCAPVKSDPSTASAPCLSRNNLCGRSTSK